MPAGASATVAGAAAGAGSGTCVQASLQQSMNGALSGCMLVGALATGSYTVVLQQEPEFSEASRTADQLGAGADRLGAGRRDARAAAVEVAGAAAGEPRVRLTVSPSSGRPGTTVTVTGRVAATVKHADADPTFCWDGCADGVHYDGVTLHWSGARTFTAKLVVPAAPWIEGAPARVARLVSASYPISIECLVIQDSGCPGAEGTAHFGLHVPASPAWCPTAASCARLTLTPATAKQGAFLRVTGHAPLVSVIGSDQPFVFELQVLTGVRKGPEVQFTRDEGGVSVTFGRAVLRVRPAPSFASLRSTAPIAGSETTAGLSRIAADPSDPSTVAWCGNGSISLSQAGVISGRSRRAARPPS